MARPDQKRISVLRENKLVPLLPIGTDLGITREQPWEGLLLERHLVRAAEIPEHEHRDFCIHLQLSGAADFEWWSGGKHRIEKTEPGIAIVLPPGTSDRLLWRGESNRLILSIQSDQLSSFAADLGCVRVPEFNAKWAVRDHGLRHLITEMGREAQADWPLGSLYADLLRIGIQSQLLQNYALERVRIPESRGGIIMPRLRRALEYINENLESDLRLENIARELHLSPFHFAREFRSSTGQTPYQYLLDQRMEKAKTLLRIGRDSIQEIALDCGFSSTVNFTRTFRQRVGAPPGVWRDHAKHS